MKKEQNLTPPPTLQTLIKSWKLNKELLSSRMKMLKLMIEECGIIVDQAETFFVEPKKELVEA
jgi:hypothetical protein